MAIQEMYHYLHNGLKIIIYGNNKHNDNDGNTHDDDYQN